MKKIHMILLNVLLVLSLVACDSGIDGQMPEPFLNMESTGGDELRGYFIKYDAKFTSLDSNVLNLVDKEECEAWINNFTLGEREPSESNILNFVSEFNIPKEKLLEAISTQYYIEGATLTTEDVDIIYSNDMELINQTYISDYALYYNGGIYTPEWIYTNSLEKYEEEGIPAELVDEAMQKFKSFPFTEEALAAMDKKVDTYRERAKSVPIVTQEEITITESIQDNVQAVTT